jgi:hypothetical protein
MAEDGAAGRAARLVTGYVRHERGVPGSPGGSRGAGDVPQCREWLLRAATITAGEFVQASGLWVNDRTHGLQLKASFLKAARAEILLYALETSAGKR